MSISGIFGKANLSQIDFTVDIPREVYAKAPLPIKITLRNNRRLLPAFLIRLTTEKWEVLFPYTPPGGRTSLFASVSFEERGIHRIDGGHIRSVFPFNFFTRFKRAAMPIDIIVFPSLKSCEMSVLYGQEQRVRGDRPSGRLGHDSDVVSIREYVRGDAIKYIHWKASARTGRLKTKEYASLSYQPIVIDFDEVAIRDVEEKLSCIAYALTQLCRQKVPVGLKIGDKSYAPDTVDSHRMALLKELALYGLTPKPIASAQLGNNG